MKKIEIFLFVFLYICAIPIYSQSWRPARIFFVTNKAGAKNEDTKKIKTPIPYGTPVLATQWEEVGFGYPFLHINWNGGYGMFKVSDFKDTYIDSLIYTDYSPEGLYLGGIDCNGNNNDGKVKIEFAKGKVTLTKIRTKSCEITEKDYEEFENYNKVTTTIITGNLDPPINKLPHEGLFDYVSIRFTEQKTGIKYDSKCIKKTIPIKKAPYIKNLSIYPVICSKVKDKGKSGIVIEGIPLIFILKNTSY